MHNKEQMQKCKCKHNGIQDSLHVIYECSATRDTVDTALEKVEQILQKPENQCALRYNKMNRNDRITYMYSLSGLRTLESLQKPTRVQ